MAAAHKAAVQSLFRRCLKEYLNRGEEREFFYQAVPAIREQFEKHRHVDLAVGKALLERGEAHLNSIKTPDPYIIPYAHGGSMYARNPPLPKGLKHHLNWE